MKYFRWSEEYILNSSWQKIILYAATIPDYSIDKKDDKGEKVIKVLDGADLSKYF